MWRAVNHPRRDPDRITADELSYDLHIHVRVELERALVRGDLVASELPAAWAEAYRRVLGATPPDDLAGCLQDGHWAEGMIGFFPTYTIGNAIAAQLMQQLRGRCPRSTTLSPRGTPNRSSRSCASGSIASAASSPPRRWSSGPRAPPCRSSP